MDNLLQQEERKREHHWDAQERWRQILEAISWAEGQSTVRRNTPQYCLAEQLKKLTARPYESGARIETKNESIQF